METTREGIQHNVQILVAAELQASHITTSQL